MSLLSPRRHDPQALPAELLTHSAFRQAWQGVEPDRVWDAHVHLIGLGDTDSGVWVNPRMRAPWNLMRFLAMRAYLKASGIGSGDVVDRQFVRHLLAQLAHFPPGCKALLLAFDWFHDDSGTPRPELSGFHVPNHYAASVARAHGERLVWAASIHPYRPDACEALEQAVRDGARAVKWLPQAMGIDPASSRCDAFYEAMKHHRLPLLCHAGEEQATPSGADQSLGNPLRLRRPLAHGVRVIIAHCASLGLSEDLDRPEKGRKRLPSFQLFARLMDEAAWQDGLMGDLSATVLLNRSPQVLEWLLDREAWHSRLLQGSDYPLPGITPIIWTGRLVRRGLLDAEQASWLNAIRRHNPLLFDWLLKRSLRKEGRGFPAAVFETARHFAGGA
ncbi:MAG: amidohydrolase [Magnetococcales bacterium]|nr:amidohydrolase [Magnetococcales bacterium]